MEPGNWITIGVFAAGLVLAAIGGYYGFIRNIENRVTIIEQRCINHQVIIDSIATLNSRLEKVTNDNETFWKILGPHLAGIIHSPVSRARDELVDELVCGSIDECGARQLVDYLVEAISSDRWDGNKRLAGALLLARTRNKLRELEAAKTIERRVS